MVPERYIEIYSHADTLYLMPSIKVGRPWLRLGWVDTIPGALDDERLGSPILALFTDVRFARPPEHLAAVGALREASGRAPTTFNRTAKGVVVGSDGETVSATPIHKRGPRSGYEWSSTPDREVVRPTAATVGEMIRAAFVRAD